MVALYLYACVAAPAAVAVALGVTVVPPLSTSLPPTVGAICNSEAFNASAVL